MNIQEHLLILKTDNFFYSNFIESNGDYLLLGKYHILKYKTSYGGSFEQIENMGVEYLN